MRVHPRPWHVLFSLVLSGTAMIVFAGDAGTRWNNGLINVGSGFIGAVITFLLLERYLPRISNANGSRRDGFSYSAFAAHVKRSKNRVRVLSTFIYPLTSHPEYQKEKKEFVEAVKRAVEKNRDIDIQILLLDPSSEAAKQRAEERKDDDVILRIRENLSELYRLREEPYHREVFERVEVKLYDRLPPLSVFQWDDRASMSFYPRQKKITETVRFEFATDTPLGAFMHETFEDVWNDPATKELDDYIFLRVQIEHRATGRTITPRVHFVESPPNSFYVLLNVDRDEHALALLNGELAHSHVSVARGKEILPCTCSRLEMSEHVRRLATRKYGHFEYQSMLELCLASVTDPHRG